MRGSASRGSPRRAEITEVALGLYAERGFRAVSVDDVARAAGASKTTITRFFGGGAGLVRAALVLEGDIVLAPLEAAAHDLDEFARVLHDTVYDDRCLTFLAFVLGEARSHPDVSQIFDEAVVQRIARTVAPAVADAAGTTGDPDRTSAAVQRFLGDLLGLDLLLAVTGRSPDPELLADRRRRAVAAVRRDASHR
ncbi:TetR/AcrR family transcriptional regulator [Cellulomonas sp.]|uniref:TetR/AcrR family transcriptional regulator n=1 Tax=Cellulomonas sp. TaxID=40001 RepID=UPI001B091DB4|nr:TetR/AcrR family transcriptional regulator [Cellulomonas sp.]MBO9555134.1 TetR/AcrR family transcriptional regulator [Cellulomonas sp.]